MELTVTEMELKIRFQFQHQFSLLYFSILSAANDTHCSFEKKIVEVFFKEGICLKISYHKVFSV